MEIWHRPRRRVRADESLLEEIRERDGGERDGLENRDVPPASTLTLQHQLVANHQDAELRVYPDEDYTGTALSSTADSTAFLRRVFGPHSNH